MSWGPPLKLVPNHSDDLTRFLCILFLVPILRSRFQASIKPLLNHPTGTSLQTTAIRPPGTLHISLRSMNLVKFDDATAASKLLGSIDIVDILELASACFKSGFKFDARRYVVEQL